jgi:hypothetical protein
MCMYITENFPSRITIKSKVGLKNTSLLKSVTKPETVIKIII